MMGSLRMVKLDFFTMKSQFAMYLSLVAIVIMFALMGSSLAVLCITCSWFVALVSSNIFVIQEKNNLDRLYGTLSVNLKDIVLGRYMFVFLNYFLSFLLILILYSGFALIQNKEFNLQEIFLGFSLSFLIFSVIVGIQMPLFFKMGFIKAKVWSLVPFIAVMVLIVIPSFVDAPSDVVEFMYVNQNIFMVCGILSSCAILFMSYHASLIVYGRRR